MRMYRFKRIVDIFVALLGLVVLSPLVVTLSILTYVFIGSPVFFRQARPGLKGTPFRIYKIRTMRELRSEDGRLRSDAERVTKFGRLLRSTSLDELPELFNVLKGDMSLVGPRPLLMRHLHNSTPEQARRFDVRPGITGWAQVNGRNNLSNEERVEFDIWYIDNWSVLLDIKILFLTIVKVVKREGDGAEGATIGPGFTGE